LYPVAAERATRPLQRLRPPSSTRSGCRRRGAAFLALWLFVGGGGGRASFGMIVSFSLAFRAPRSISMAGVTRGFFSLLR